MTWEHATTDFLEADVIEWTEAIWSPNRSRKKKRPWGKQAIIGQITGIDGDFISVMILRATIIENTVGSDLVPYKVGAAIIKKRLTLLKGNLERLHWSEEDVRAALLAELRN